MRVDVVRDAVANEVPTGGRDTVPQGPAAVLGQEPAAKLGVPDDLLPELCKMIRAAGARKMRLVDDFIQAHPELSALQTETTIREVAVHVKLECDEESVWHIRPAFHHHLEPENGYDPGRQQLLLRVIQKWEVRKQKKKQQKKASKELSQQIRRQQTERGDAESHRVDCVRRIMAATATTVGERKFVV